MSKVQVGIIGLGDHCWKSHIKHVLEMKDICQIVAVCDLQVEKAQELSKNLSISDSNDLHYYATYEELLQDEKVEAVFIMTPDRFHLEQLIQSTKCKKHVFCEKPLALNRDEFERLQYAFSYASEHNLVITTCHPRRFDPPFAEMKEFVNTNPAKLGKVLNFEFYFQYHKPSKHGLHTSLMFDHLNHEVDAMNYLFGQSSIKHAVKHYDSETAFHVSGLREDGISFSFIGQRKLEDSIYPEYMKVNFEGGFATMDLHRGIFYVDTGTVKTTQQFSKCMTDYAIRFAAINSNFLKSILGAEKPYLTASEMLMNTKLAIDLHEKTFVEY